MKGSLPEGWKLIGAPVPGPGGQLQRAAGPHQQLGMVLQYRADMEDHPALAKVLDPLGDLLQAPGLEGVRPLVHWDCEHGWFLYDVGEARLLSEIVEECNERGVVPGERVALELLAELCEVLDGITKAPLSTGFMNHGALNPFRIVVYPNGKAALLGYGLPPLEVIDWLQDDTDTLPGAGLRYTPPERIRFSKEEEDLRSDLYSVGMIVGGSGPGAGPSHRLAGGAGGPDPR